MAGILETFLILFESDAKKVEKDANAAEHATQRLTERINLGHGAAIKLGESLHDTVLELAAMAGTILAVGASIDGIKQSLEFAARLHDISESLGINIEDLSAWGDAVKKEGGSAEGLAGSLNSLAVAFNQVDVTGKSRLLPFFKELGINMLNAHGKARPVLDVLTDLSKKFETMSKQESLAFGRKIGLDDGLIRLLQKGNEGLKEAIAHERALGVVTKEQGDLADELGDNIDDLTHVLRTFGLMIGGIVAPPLTWMIKQFVSLISLLTEVPRFVERNSQYLTDLGITVGIVGAIIASAYIPTVIRAIIATGAWIAANELLIATFVILAGRAALALLPWILGFIALGLVIADIHAAFVGGRSYFADFINFLGDGIKGIYKWFKDWYDLIINIIDAIAKIAGSKIGGLINGTVEIGHKILGQADNTPLNSQTSSSIANSQKSINTTTSIDKVEIHTQSNDPEGIRRVFESNMQQHTKQTLDNYTDGVKT